MLKLGDEFVTFEACSTLSDIFFDHLNQRICTVRGNGEMGITAKGLKENDTISFRIPDQGKLRSLNFSPDSQIAAIRRDDSTVEFVFLDDRNALNPQIVKQMCKRSEAIVLGVQWVSNRQIILISDQGLEFYSINTKRFLVKFIKSVNVATSWFASYTPSQLIFLSSGISNSVLNPFIVQSNIIHSLSKFEVDFGCSAFRPKLLDRDITVASIYERISVLVLKGGTKNGFTERINIYEFSRNDPFSVPQLTRTLKLNLDGLIGVHVVDNVIFVHHKNSKSSLVYEVGPSFDSDEASSKSKHIQEILPLCITDVEVAEPLKDVFHGEDEVSLYSQSSAIFSPNLVADVRLGIFTSLRLIVKRVVNFIKDNNLLLEFLIKRSNAEDVFLEVFKRCLLNKLIKISKICKIFQQILRSNSNALNTPVIETKSTKCQLHVIPLTPQAIDHNTILRNVFDPLRDYAEMDKKFLSYLVLEFFHIVKRMKISLEQNYLPEFLLKVLVDAKQFKKLQQLLQYGVIDDSKFLAFELISLSQEYEPLHQMAIDMLARRDNAEQIAEILIAQGKVIEGARCLAVENHYRNYVSLDRVHCLKLLEGAWRTKNRHIMYTVFCHLRYVQKLRFFDGTHEGFEQYIQDFEMLFKVEEIEEAEKRFRLARISSVRRKGNERTLLDHESDDDNVSESGNTDNGGESEEAGSINSAANSNNDNRPNDGDDKCILSRNEGL